MEPDWFARWLGLASLGIAGVSLLWQMLTELRLDRPRLRVALAHANLRGGVGGRLVIPAVSVEVINDGKRPTQLNSVLIVAGRRRPRILRRIPFGIGAKLTSVTAVLPEWQSVVGQVSTRLPITLEPGGQASLFFEPESIASLARDTGRRRIHATASATTARGRSRSIKAQAEAKQP